MATIVFYEKPGCATNARQRRLLVSAGHEVITRNLLAEPWTAARLRAFFGNLPLPDWFNRAAPRIKSGELDPQTLTVEDALALMLANPILIRRPLLEIGTLRIAGFDPQVLQASMGFTQPRGTRAVPDCPHLPIPHRPRM